MRVAYADPPYIGQAKKHYGKEKTYAGEVDHAQLAVRLSTYDGWALSASSPSLPMVLPLCPRGARIGAWVKPFCAFKKGVRPAYAWEPVIFYGGRNPPAFKHPPPIKGGKQTTPKDYIAESITLKRGLTGAKPERFCFWIFDLLNAAPEDEFVDLFPGTGAVTRAWETWKKMRGA